MNAEQRAAALARCEAATPGPWTVVPGGWGVTSEACNIAGAVLAMHDGGRATDEHPVHPDAEFVAAARTDLPAALAEIEHLEERLTKVRALLPRCGGVVRFTSLISAQCVKRVGHDGPCDNRYKEGNGG